MTSDTSTASRFNAGITARRPFSVRCTEVAKLDNSTRTQTRYSLLAAVRRQDKSQSRQSRIHLRAGCSPALKTRVGWTKEPENAV